MSNLSLKKQINQSGVFSGAIGNDGNECPVMCPTKCNEAEEMPCYGGSDYNGCMYPEFCWPSKGSM